MATYQWKGKKHTGEYLKGEITAENYEQVIEEIRKKDIYPISVKKKSEFR